MDSTTTEPDLTLTPASVDCVKAMGAEMNAIGGLLDRLVEYVDAPGSGDRADVALAGMVGHVGSGVMAGMTALVHELAALRKALEAGRNSNEYRIHLSAEAAAAHGRALVALTEGKV